MTRMLPTSVHICHLYASCGQSPYVTIFHRVVNRVERIHCSRQKGTLDYIPSTSANRSVGPHSISLPPPPHNHCSSQGKTKHLLIINYIGLLGPYLQYVISKINTCWRVATPRSLTDTDGGYNRWSSTFL
jgi:hypothetical protein